MLEQSVAKTPAFAPGYAALAMSYDLGGSGEDVLPPTEAASKAKTAALQAIKLQPALSEAHTALAYEEVTFEHDWSAADGEFRRALELNPNSADAHYFYALAWLTPVGRHDEAITEVNKALLLDPLSLPHNQGAVYIFYYARRYQDALDQANKAEALDPNFAEPHWRLFEIYTQLGRIDEALSEKEKAWLLMGDSPGVVLPAIATIRQAAAKSGARGFWQQEAEIFKKYDLPVTVARFYARLGDKNDAFQWLEKGLQYRDSDIPFIAVDPGFDSLRSDPRYKDLVRRIGLPQ